MLARNLPVGLLLVRGQEANLKGNARTGQAQVGS